MQFGRLIALFISFAIFACNTPGTDAVLHPSAAPATGVEAGTRFEKLSPERSGIQFTPQIRDEHRYNFMGDPYIYNGGGVSVVDVNNDGLQDLFFTNRLQGCRLYLNKGGLHFEDISESSGVARFSGLKTGSVVVDINADGWPDIYVCRTWLEPLPDRRNLLFINNKDNTFSEQAAAYNLDDLSASQHANFLDIDRDGDLDCYILNHPVDFKTMNNLDAVADARQEQPRNEWESDRLLLNENGKFRDITRSSGIRNRAFGLSTIAADFNDDGWPDIFVGNDFVMPDFLYINNHNGTFTDQAGSYFRHTSNHTMGADFADLSGDGRSDLVSLDMLAEPLERRLRLMSTMQRARDQQMRIKGYGKQVMRNTVQLSNGNGGFNEIGCLTGMYATDWSWAPLIADYDLDGKPDVFISNGIQRDLNDLDFFIYTADSINQSGGISKGRFPDFNLFANMMPSHPVHNYLFRNLGDLHFADVSEAAGFHQTGFSNGAAYSDLDNDGDLDLITNNLQTPPAIYENKANTTGNHWLQVKCKGTARNPFGIGAKVRVYRQNRLLFSQEMTNVRGFYSSVEPIFEIGLGAENAVDRVEIDWLEGKFQVLGQVAANQRLILDIANAKPGKCPEAPLPPGFDFQECAESIGLNFTHQENQFEDFDREKLLPWRLSTRGPALALADLNGDHLTDVFVGGAAGFSGVVFQQESGGNFKKTVQPALEQDKNFEDTGAVFFDSDGDGDQDLFVTSGGNESPANSPGYQSRLYRNDGAGHFSRAQQAVPAWHSPANCVLVLDVDRDGDTDILIGGGAVPGRYPEAAGNVLLMNEGGNFTKKNAPSFSNAGIINSLTAADLDGDGKPEILAAGEWAPLRVFQFVQGELQEKTTAMGLAQSSGLWRSITTGDVDHDGDLDIIAGNIGGNTDWKVWKGAPLRLFAADFDKNGSLDPVMAEAENGHYHPVWQRDILASRMPFIKKEFQRNAPYSTAPIEKILPEKALLSGISLQAEILESCWFENRKGAFICHPLPEYAQFSPAESILFQDITGDGAPDLILVGNDYGMNIETYQLDASDGCVFPGKSGGGFENTPLRIGARLAARKAGIFQADKNGPLLIVANNNGPVQCFRFRGSSGITN